MKNDESKDTLEKQKLAEHQVDFIFDHLGIDRPTGKHRQVCIDIMLGANYTPEEILDRL